MILAFPNIRTDFAHWLNLVDARIDYDCRRDLGSVATWRRYYDRGASIAAAVEDLKLVRDNRAFCNVEV